MPRFQRERRYHSDSSTYEGISAPGGGPQHHHHLHFLPHFVTSAPTAAMTFRKLITAAVVLVLILFTLVERHYIINAERNPREVQLHRATREKYLGLLMKAVTGSLYHSRGIVPGSGPLENLIVKPYNAKEIAEATYWPETGLTMVGTESLKKLQMVIDTVVHDGIEGDFLEAGVWRGGASIFAKGVIESLGEGRDRKVWVCDSFEGYPKNSSNEDSEFYSTLLALIESEEKVRRNFNEYGLLDAQVRFVKGFFWETLPLLRKLPFFSKIAVLHADGDMYESTMDILFNLYDRIPIGGFLIIDDYNPVKDPARRATEQFRTMHDITEPVYAVVYDKDQETYNKAYWRKEREVQLKYSWYEEYNQKRHLKTNIDGDGENTRL